MCHLDMMVVGGGRIYRVSDRIQIRVGLLRRRIQLQVRGNSARYAKVRVIDGTEDDSIVH